MLNVNQLIGFGVGGSDNKHKFWRVNMPVGGPSTYTYVTEITMASSAGGADQCNGGTPSASSSMGTHPPTYAFNNVLSTSDYWQSGADGACWLQYEFLSPVSVAEFTVSVYAAAPNIGPSTIELQYSDDGITFTTVFSTSATWTAGSITKTYTVPE